MFITTCFLSVLVKENLAKHEKYQNIMTLNICCDLEAKNCSQRESWTKYLREAVVLM